MKKWLRLFTFLAVSAVAFTMLIPFLWMVSTSLKTDLEVYSFPPVLVPKEIKWSNYPEALTLQPFGRFFFQ